MPLFPDLSRRMAAAMLAITLVGCASAPTRFQPLPETLSTQAGIPGIPGARHWGDMHPPASTPG